MAPRAPSTAAIRAGRRAFTTVPAEAAAIAAWEREGEPILEEMRRQADGRLADYVVSHAGQESFPRSFQLLANTAR
jgi:acrylyl-CoA reductase (NADPH)/3-hydroxypropionyl-CoA dehydratase/3-hydroxypropionyl-CoA synthetase